MGERKNEVAGRDVTSLMGTPSHGLGLSFCGKIRPEDEGTFGKGWGAFPAEERTTLASTPSCKPP